MWSCDYGDKVRGVGWRLTGWGVTGFNVFYSRVCGTLLHWRVINTESPVKCNCCCCFRWNVVGNQWRRKLSALWLVDDLNPSSYIDNLSDVGISLWSVGLFTRTIPHFIYDLLCLEKSDSLRGVFISQTIYITTHHITSHHIISYHIYSREDIVTGWNFYELKLSARELWVEYEWVCVCELSILVS